MPFSGFRFENRLHGLGAAVTGITHQRDSATLSTDSDSVNQQNGKQDGVEP
jgi:hypothetical protein